MSQECCTENKEIMILACSGASSVGQLSNQAAVELTHEGFGKMICLAAVGAHLGSFVQAARKAKSMVAIDGCPLCCVKRLLEHAEVPLGAHVVLYDLGIEKTMDTVLVRDEVEKVKAAIKEACNGHMRPVAVHAGPSPSCCG
jgi:uncharacterized metal-binding protein